MAGGTARREIEDTLRASQDRVERLVADIRLALFALVVGVTTVVRLTARDVDTWVPTLYFAVVTALALGMRTAVRRLGARPALVHAILALDLTAAAGVFVVMARFAPPGQEAVGRSFVAWVLVPGLMNVLCVNLLRRDRGTAVAGAIEATVLALAVAPLHPPVGPPTFVAVFLAATTGLIGWFAAAEARRTLDQHARTRLLRRFVPTAAVERVMGEDVDTALALGGRAVTVTVLASDLRGFTAMSERLAPAAVVEQLNAYHGCMHAVMAAHGGMLDKFVGDGALVVFGLTTEGTDHGATAAVACARAMGDALRGLNQQRASRGEAPLAMGIGVHTGPVVAGNIGAPHARLEFTVIGDAVNTAARIEGATKEAGTPVLISAETAGRLADRSGLREVPPIALKGKSEPLRLFGFAIPAAGAGGAAGIA